MCSNPIAHDTRLRDLSQNMPVVERLRELTWWRITIGQNNEQKCQCTQYDRADHLQAVAQPFIWSVVVENHSHVLVHTVHIGLRKLVFLLEATDDHEARHTLREMMDNWCLCYWVQSCKFPRRGHVVCLHTCMQSKNHYSSSSIMEFYHPITSSSPFKEKPRPIDEDVHIFKLCIVHIVEAVTWYCK